MQNLFCNKNRGLMESQASLTTAFPNDTNFTDGTLPMTLSAVTAHGILHNLSHVLDVARLANYSSQNDHFYNSRRFPICLHNHRRLFRRQIGINKLFRSNTWGNNTTSYGACFTICRRISMKSERLYILFFSHNGLGSTFCDHCSCLSLQRSSIFGRPWNWVQVLDLEWKNLADNVHLGSYYRRGLGHHDIHNHDCVLCTGQAATKKRGM